MGHQFFEASHTVPVRPYPSNSRAVIYINCQLSSNGIGLVTKPTSKFLISPKCRLNSRWVRIMFTKLIESCELYYIIYYTWHLVSKILVFKIAQYWSYYKCITFTPSKDIVVLFSLLRTAVQQSVRACHTHFRGGVSGDEVSIQTPVILHVVRSWCQYTSVLHPSHCRRPEAEVSIPEYHCLHTACRKELRLIYLTTPPFTLHVVRSWG